MRFELTTSTLARLRSTPELRPHPRVKASEVVLFPALGKVILPPDPGEVGLRA